MEMPFSDAIIVALVTGGLSLLGTVLTVSAGNNKTDAMIKANQLVQDEKIAELTREVRAHNEFANRIPNLEARTTHLEKDVERLMNRELQGSNKTSKNIKND